MELLATGSQCRDVGALAAPPDADHYARAVAERRRAMSTVESTDDDVPWASFFNLPAFYRYHLAGRRGFHLRLISNCDGRACCAAHFTEKEAGVFVSPLRGTYGGIDATSTDIVGLELFLLDIEGRLREAGAREVQIALAPCIHEPSKSAALMNVLWRHGFGILGHELNFHVTVDGAPLIDKMERNNQKRMRKCLREGCTFTECTSHAEFARVYDVICRNRQSKGYPLSMTFEAIMEMRNLFPDRWHFFATSLGDEYIAGSICVRVRHGILYVFYWGDLPEAHTLSPVAYHANSLYGWCKSQDISLLDVGTSTCNGVPNLGLMRFKERLGCGMSLKVTMGKHF